jgi:hypothetical protein
MAGGTDINQPKAAVEEMTVVATATETGMETEMAMVTGTTTTPSLMMAHR